MTNPTAVTISVGGLADFSPRARVRNWGVVRGLVDLYGVPCNRGRDFYGDIRDAIDDVTRSRR